MAFQAGAVTATLEAKIQDFQNKMKQASQSLKGVKDTATTFAGRAANAMKDFGVSIKNFAVGALENLINWAKTAGLAVGALTATAIGFGLKTAGSLETAEIGLKTLLGSAEEASATVERIKKEAARTPFEIEGLTQAVQLMTSITKDGDKSIDTILDIGEGLAAMGKGQAELDRIIINLQQIGAVGYASMVDIKQFAYAGIPIFEMLTEATGKSGDELANMISNGGITFEMLTDMFDKANDEGGRFFNAYTDQAGSFEQSLSNMKDSINIFLADFVRQTGLFDMAKEGMKNLSIWVENNKETIINWGNTFIGYAKDIINWIGGIVAGGQSLYNDFLVWLGTPEVQQYISDLSATFQVLWDTIVQGWQLYVMPVFAQIWVAIQEYATLFMSTYHEHRAFIEGEMKIVAGVLIGLIVVIGLVILAFIQLGTWIVQTTGRALTAITNLTSAATSAWNTLMDWLGLSTEEKLKSIAYWFGWMAGESINKLNDIKNAIVQWISDLIQSIPAFIEDIKQRWADLFADLKNRFDGVKQIDLTQAGKDIVQGLINGITDKAKELTNTVKNMAESVKNGFKDALQIQSPSKVMAELGEYTGEGYIEGMKSTEGNIARESVAMASQSITATSNMNNTFNISGGDSRQIGDTIVKKLARMNNLAINGVNL